MTTEFPPLLEMLKQVPDPRHARGKRYPLEAILALMCVAALCGYKTYSAMAEWGRNYGSDYLRALGFESDRAPCKSWLSQLLPRLDVPMVEGLISEWVESVWETLPLEEGEDEVIATDGKALRCSRKQGAPGAYLLAALGCRLGMALHQRVVPEGGEDRTNEIPVMEGLLRDLFREGRLRGRIWTMDALHTQRTHAELIVEGGGDYVMVAKGNQATLRDEIGLLFESPETAPSDVEHIETVDLGHGRLETRRMYASTALNAYLDWPGVGQVFCVQRTRIHKKSGKKQEQTVYGVTSLSPDQADADRLLHVTRCHWHIENRLHWVRDVTFDEDRSTVRRENTPEIMAAIRNLVIGLIRLAGFDNVAQACRRFAAQPDKALAMIGINGEN